MKWSFTLTLLVMKVFRVTCQCRDETLCDYWAGGNRCLLSPSFMVPRCPVACQNPCACDLSATTNDTACDCLARAKQGYCDTDGALEDCFTTCTMKRNINCPKLPPPQDPNARLSTTNTSYLTDVIENCREGLETTNSINTGRKICISDGTWFSDTTVGLSIECKVVNCGQPPSLDNTVVKAPSTLYGNKATYSCITGFDHMSGQLNLTCSPTGSWDGTRLTCEYVNCGDLPSEEGIDIIATNGSNYRGFAKYNCSTGWEYQQGDTTLTCSAGSQWIGELMVCTRVECGLPNVLEKSEMTNTSTNFESVATYTCHVGHERVGGNITRVCQANRVWSATALVCSAVVCSELPVYAGARSWTLEGGIIDVDNHEPFLYQTKVFHECFYQENSAKGTTQWAQECGADKSWQGDEPRCGANSEFRRGTFEPEPEEAPGSWAVGLTIFAVIIFIIVVFIIMDMDTMRKHSKYMKANLRNFRRVVIKRWYRLRNMVQVKTTSLSDIQVKEKPPVMTDDVIAVTVDEVHDFPGDSDNGSESNFSTGSASMPSTPKTITSFV